LSACPSIGLSRHKNRQFCLDAVIVSLKYGLSTEGAVKNDGKQRAVAPAKTGSFIRGSGRGSAGSKTPPLPTKKTKMQTSGGEYGGISFEALQVLLGGN